MCRVLCVWIPSVLGGGGGWRRVCWLWEVGGLGLCGNKWPRPRLCLLGPQQPHGPDWLPTDPRRQHTLPLCWPDLVAWPPWDPTPSRACLLAVLLPCPRHHCRPVFSRPCFRLARFEPFALAAQLTGPGSSGRIHSQCSCCLLRSRSLEYIGAVFLHLPVPVALTRSLFSRYLGAHHPTPFPGSRSSSGGAHQITQVLSFSPSSLQSRL